MRRRSGFTLVEVLVAMALILFMLVILAAAFGSAMQSVGDFKATADLAERLRGAATILKRDLEADHFTDGPQNGPRMSDPSFWNRLSDPINSPPAGFFRIYQGQAESAPWAAGARAGFEGTDLDGSLSYYQTTTALHYTIALRGSRRGDFMSAFVPGSPLLNPAADPLHLLGSPDARYQDTPNVYSSQYAEALVFLAPTGDVTDGTVGTPLPLFSLNRRQFLTVPNGWAGGNPGQQIIEMSQMPGWNFNSIRSLCQPLNRFEMAGPAGAYTGPNRYTTMGEDNPNFRAADVVMSDVVSFDVRVLTAGDNEFRDLFDLYPTYSNGNSVLTGAGGAPAVFDTWSNDSTNYPNWSAGGAPTSVPMYLNKNTGQPISIKAIQISLRVWDFKTKKTRQVTLVQQM